MKRGDFCILPVRSLVDGKSRLSAVLGPTERARLNNRLFQQMLDCLEAYPGPAATIVVSGSADVLDRARRRGMIAVADPPGGLNEAVAAGTLAARAHGAHGVFVLPVDLPLVTAAALRSLLTQAPADQICLLVPDRHGVGTNLIYQSPIRLMAYEFGEDSFARHRAAAQAAGLTVVVRREPRFAIDLDVPADYELWRQLTDTAPREAGRRLGEKVETHGV